MGNDPHVDRLDRTALLAITGITLVAAGLRLWALGRPSLWLDELVTLWAAAAPSFSEVSSRVRSCMATPPVPFVIHHAILTMASASEWALRLPSALAGIAAVPVVFLASRRMFGRTAAVVAAAALAIQPLHVSASMNARPYALAVLLASGSLWAFSKCLHRGNTRAIVAWVLCAAALIHTQFVFSAFLLAQGLAYLILRIAGKVPLFAPKRFVGAVGAVALLCVPLESQVATDFTRRHGLAWTAQEGIGTTLARLLELKPLLLTAVFAAVILLIRVARSKGRAARPPFRFAAITSPDVLTLLLCTLLPVLLLGIASTMPGMGSLARSRYVTASLAPAACLIGWILTRPVHRIDRALIAGAYLALVIATGIAPSLASGRTLNASARSQDWRSAGAFLGRELREGDVVLLRSGLVESDAYVEGAFPESCASYLAAALPPLYVGRSIDPVILPARFPPPPRSPQFDTHIGARIAGRDRLWLVVAAPPDAEGYLRSLMNYLGTRTGKRLAIARSEVFGQILVALVVLPPA